MTQAKTGHWYLEDLTPTAIVVALASSSKSRKITIKTAAEWQRILGHPGIRAIESLPDNTEGVEFDASNAIATIDCETCLLSKAKAVISRQTSKNREACAQSESQKMAVASWDLIEMVESADGNKFLSHFYYDAEAFHVLYPEKSKSNATAGFKAHFICMISL